jgi:hypothetical protein
MDEETISSGFVVRRIGWRFMRGRRLKTWVKISYILHNIRGVFESLDIRGLEGA